MEAKMLIFSDENSRHKVYLLLECVLSVESYIANGRVYYLINTNTLLHYTTTENVLDAWKEYVNGS